MTYLCGEVLPSPLARLVATRPPGAPPSAALQAFAERMEEMYRLGE
ncbi:hypothetical protein V8J36_18875 [Frigidibacter sp. MR17.14]